MAALISKISRHRRLLVGIVSFAIAAAIDSRPACPADALDRMALDRLKATHEAVELFKQDRQPVSLPSQFSDYRALLHVHSYLSHDSRGTVEEIRAAAKETGVRVIMFTEHPADHYDYYKDGHRGLVDGVLFIPGAEEKGLLAYPQASVDRSLAHTPQEKVNAVRNADGQVFLCHLEERMDWELDGLTGTEIYNTHADFKDEPRLVRALANPLSLLLTIRPALQQYPQETFAALLDYPADYLKRWDELLQKSRLTGVSANDAHHNTGLRAVIADDGTIQLESALGKPLTRLDPQKLPVLKPLLLGKQPGDVVFHLDLDPYARSFRHVSTHLLMKQQSEPDVREALQAGRAYVAFDWLCDPTGFNFQAVQGETVYEMGSEITLSGGLKLRSVAPLPGTFHLLRNGQQVKHTRSHTFEHDVDQPGIYRLEVWLNLPDAPQIWILSNPIYVRGSDGNSK